MFIINTDCTDVIDGVVNIIVLIIRMYIYHADVVIQRGSLGVTLDEKPEHRVVAMGIPSCQKDDMFPFVVHCYLMSMISASGKSASLKVKKSSGSVWFVANFVILYTNSVSPSLTIDISFNSKVLTFKVKVIAV